MSTLTIWQDGSCRQIHFNGTPVLQEVLEQAGLYSPHPCGGNGICGKCTVKLSGSISAPNASELSFGTRLSCQAQLQGDATVWLNSSGSIEQIESGMFHNILPVFPASGHWGVAVDIGTTTIALKVCNLKNGAILTTQTCLNPQITIAADVMGRINAAINGKLALLQEQVQSSLHQLLKQACKYTQIQIQDLDALVITGNTTMLYLLTGRDPEELSHAPFLAGCLFGFETEILNIPTYLPPCMNSFVGADITCAVLASGMTNKKEISLLCDIGTNGELALWKDETLYVTSTAAGPAFEGAGISCGCGSVLGAIDRVWIQDNHICTHTIGEVPATGLCGSGLVDAIATLLHLEQIDSTGATTGDLALSSGVHLIPKDIRTVQLAKAAIAAGIQTLLESANVSIDQVSTLYIAGGFGSHLNVENAAAIGLIPSPLKDRVQVIGNGALTGALMLLLNRHQISNCISLAVRSKHISLGGNSKFNANYIDQMFFADESSETSD